MARIKRAVNAHKSRRKVMKLAKGYWGAKSKQYRAAKEQVARSLRYAFIGRKLRKRDFRRLWITRINAAARLNGMSYSTFINGLKSLPRPAAAAVFRPNSTRATSPREKPAPDAQRVKHILHTLVVGLVVDYENTFHFGFLGLGFRV